MLTKLSPGTFSSKSRRSVTYHAPTAPGNASTNTLTLSCSEPSLTSAIHTAHVASHYTYLENLSFTQRLSKQLNILKVRIDDILSFLQLMERSSMTLPKNFVEKWIESSGLTEQITSTQKALSSLKTSGSSGSSSKKRQKRSSRSGRSFHGSR